MRAFISSTPRSVLQECAREKAMPTAMSVNFMSLQPPLLVSLILSTSYLEESSQACEHSNSCKKLTSLMRSQASLLRSLLLVSTQFLLLKRRMNDDLIINNKLKHERLLSVQKVHCRPLHLMHNSTVNYLPLILQFASSDCAERLCAVDCEETRSASH